MQDDFQPPRRADNYGDAPDLSTPKIQSEIPVTPHPEDVANNEQGAVALPVSKGKLRSFRLARFRWPKLSKKQWILAGAGGLLFIGGTGYGLYSVFKSDPPPPAPAVVQQVEPEPEPEPTTAPSPLTGLEVDIPLTKRRVTGVMIENSPDARPQAGLREAGIVFEAIAEGGITRFMALFQEARPAHIGPVRSVRPYYLDFVLPFDAAFVHAGGSAQGLADIKKLNVKDLNHNSTAFRRVTNRYAPHNLYTDMDKLDAYADSRGFKESKFTPLKRKEEKPAETPTTKSIDLKISSFLYNPSFSYDAKTNSYLRSMAGKPHVDEKSGKQIAPKTVVALVMSHRYSGIYSVYGTTGKGQAFVFQDGTVTKATWHKKSRQGQFSFTDAKGRELALNAGQTWFSLVSSAGAVSY